MRLVPVKLERYFRPFAVHKYAMRNIFFKSDSTPEPSVFLPKYPIFEKVIFAADVYNADKTPEHSSTALHKCT